MYVSPFCLPNIRFGDEKILSWFMVREHTGNETYTKPGTAPVAPCCRGLFAGLSTHFCWDLRHPAWRHPRPFVLGCALLNPTYRRGQAEVAYDAAVGTEASGRGLISEFDFLVYRHQWWWDNINRYEPDSFQIQGVSILLLFPRRGKDAYSCLLF